MEELTLNGGSSYVCGIGTIMQGSKHTKPKRDEIGNGTLGASCSLCARELPRPCSSASCCPDFDRCYHTPFPHLVGNLLFADSFLNFTENSIFGIFIISAIYHASVEYRGLNATMAKLNELPASFQQPATDLFNQVEAETGGPDISIGSYEMAGCRTVALNISTDFGQCSMY